MRLIECYIEAFGKLKDFRYSFKEGLNVINEENGFGKTTLSVFIKAMLYGLEDTKRASIFENDRKHYLPWQGGNAGGWLTFLANGKSYKVERTFAPKASDDTYALYELESGKVSNDYGTSLGEGLFGIDADGFERTVFLSERNLSVKNENKTVSAKLSNLVGYEFDLGDLDSALDALDERRKYYYKKGGAGKISDVKAKISDTDAEISRILRISDTLPEREKQLSNTLAEIEKCEIAIAEYSRRSRNAANERLYLEKRAAKEDALKKLCTYKAFFEKGIPSQAEIRDAERRADECRTLRERLANTADVSEKRSSLSTDISEADRHIAALSGEKPKKKQPLPLFILSIVSAAAGAVLAAAVNLIFGIALIAVGAVLLAVAVALSTGRVKNEGGELIEAYTYLARHSRSDANPDVYLTELIAVRTSLASELAVLAEKSKERDALLAQLLEAEGAEREFLSRFPTVSADPFAEIRNMLMNYEYIGGRVAEIAREIDYIVSQYGIDETIFDGSERRAAEPQESPTETEARLRAHRSEYAIKEREYRTACEEVSRLDELNERRCELGDELALCQSRLDTIVYAKEHLTLARESLTAKYLGKTRSAFAEYIEILTGEDSSLFTMSVDFGVVRTAGSVSRPTDAYSLGTREMYSLAARLALADSLYDGEMPFVLLDDPFAHFDDKRAAAAIKAISRLAERRQVIYLTCSKSRAI